MPEPLCEGRDPPEPGPGWGGGDPQSLEPGALRRGRGDPGEPRPLSPFPGPPARLGPAPPRLLLLVLLLLLPPPLRAPQRGRGAHGPGGAEGRRGPAGKHRARTPAPSLSPLPSAPNPPRRAPGPLQHRSETQERRFDLQKSLFVFSVFKKNTLKKGQSRPPSPASAGLRAASQGLGPGAEGRAGMRGAGG